MAPVNHNPARNKKQLQHCCHPGKGTDQGRSEEGNN